MLEAFWDYFYRPTVCLKWDRGTNRAGRVLPTVSFELLCILLVLPIHLSLGFIWSKIMNRLTAVLSNSDLYDFSTLLHYWWMWYQCWYWRTQTDCGCINNRNIWDQMDLVNGVWVSEWDGENAEYLEFPDKEQGEVIRSYYTNKICHSTKMLLSNKKSVSGLFVF